MNTISAQVAGLAQVFQQEIDITSRREIEPLLAKAMQILSHYDKSLNLSSMICDRAGQVIKTAEYKRQMRFCEFCRRSIYNPSKIWQGDVYPCSNLHLDAFGESRHSSKTQIYTCNVGFAYWSSPLYRNGRFTGTMSAGQVLSCGKDEAVKNFREQSKDRLAAEKFRQLLEDVEEKSNEEIKAMSQLLEICAEEISEKKKNSGSSLSLKHDSDYPMEEEQALLAAFRRGDTQSGTELLNNLLASISAATDDIEIIRLRALQLLVLLSRAAVEKQDSSSVQDRYSRYYKKISESNTHQELAENLKIIAGRFAVNVFSFKGMRHSSVLRKAERYIRENYTGKIGLKDTARISGLSAPYFSSVFKEEMGENFSSYLNRLRIEKAIALLTGTTKSLNEIAALCGFEDQSWFSKIFKKTTGVSPTKYRGAI